MESGECSGRCYLLLHSLQARDVAQFTSLVCTVDGPGVLLDRFPSRIAEAVTALIAIEARFFRPAADSWRSLPSLDPFELLSSSAAAVKANVLDTEAMDLLLSSSRRQQLRQSLEANPVHSCPQREQHVAVLTRQSLLAERVDRLRACLDESNLSQMADYGSRLEMLQRLHYIDADRAVLIKGRVACELNTCDSVIGTELIFDNSLGDLSELEILSLLSCLIFKERGAEQPPLTDRLQLCLDRLTAACSRVARVSDECGLDVDVAVYVSEQVNPALMEVVHAWAEQQSFVDICQLTNVLEGSIVRAITRLEETCKDIRSAARLIGDVQLYEKMTQASLLIKRSASQDTHTHIHTYCHAIETDRTVLTPTATLPIQHHCTVRSHACCLLFSCCYRPAHVAQRHRVCCEFIRHLTSQYIVFAASLYVSCRPNTPPRTNDVARHNQLLSMLVQMPRVTLLCCYCAGTARCNT